MPPVTSERDDLLRLAVYVEEQPQSVTPDSLISLDYKIHPSDLGTFLH